MKFTTRLFAFLLIASLAWQMQAQTIHLPAYVPGQNQPVIVFNGIESSKANANSADQAVTSKTTIVASTVVAPKTVTNEEAVKLTSLHQSDLHPQHTVNSQHKVKQEKKVIVRAVPAVREPASRIKADNERVINVEVIVESKGDKATGAEAKPLQPAATAYGQARVISSKESAGKPRSIQARVVQGRKVQSKDGPDARPQMKESSRTIVRESNVDGRKTRTEQRTRVASSKDAEKKAVPPRRGPGPDVKGSNAKRPSDRDRSDRAPNDGDARSRSARPDGRGNTPDRSGGPRSPRGPGDFGGDWKPPVERGGFRPNMPGMQPYVRRPMPAVRDVRPDQVKPDAGQLDFDKVMKSTAGKQMMSLIKENLELRAEMEILKIKQECEAEIAELKMELQKRELQLEETELRNRMDELEEYEEELEEFEEERDEAREHGHEHGEHERERGHAEREELEMHLRETEERFHHAMEEFEMRGREFEGRLDDSRRELAVAQEENEKLRNHARVLEEKLTITMKEMDSIKEHAMSIKQQAEREMDVVKSNSEKALRGMAEQLEAMEQKAKALYESGAASEGKLKLRLESSLKEKSEMEHRIRLMENKALELQKKLKSTSVNEGEKFPAMEWAKRQIEKYDANEDGVLTAKEWKKMLIPPEGADADKDGKLTVEEYAKFRETMRSK